jgi:hypothetical protein
MCHPKRPGPALVTAPRSVLAAARLPMALPPDWTGDRRQIGCARSCQISDAVTARASRNAVSRRVARTDGVVHRLPRTPPRALPSVHECAGAWVRLFRGRDVFAPHDTSRQPNTHSTESREVSYPWHPWFGRSVAVYEVLVKYGHSVCRCGLEEERTRRSVEIPTWMFEPAACCRLRGAISGHSGISRASSRHSGATGGYAGAALIPDTVLPVYSGDRAIRLSRAVASRRTGLVGPGGRLPMIMRPRRLTGTSRKPPIGWPQRGRIVRRPRVPSGLLEPRPLCRSTSRQASVRETPSVEAPGCVPGRRTRLIAGSW